jgi:hypothetical protein
MEVEYTMTVSRPPVRSTSFIAAIIAVGLTVAVPAEAKTGRLVLPTLLSGRDAKQVTGFVPSTLWIYSESGEALAGPGPDSGWATGKSANLEEGWYLIEVGNVRAKENRARIFVKSGKTTVVPSGVVLVNVEAAEQQPPDRCPVWDASMDVFLGTLPEPGIRVASNREAPGQHRTGAVQVLAGFYRIGWNGFHKTIEVRSHHIYTLETGFAMPHAAHDYAIFDVKDRNAGGPTMRLCRTRRTRLLPRAYHGTFTRPTQQPPFKERVWDTLRVVPPESKKGPYQRIKGKGIRGRVYAGAGSAPLLLWEIPKPTVAPQSDEPQSGNNAPVEPPTDEGAAK